MHALLTTMLATLGAGFATWGFARTLRHRFSVRDRGRSVHGRRTGVVLYAVGGLLLLLPDVFAGAMVDSPAATDSVLAVLGTVGAVIWRMAVVLGLSLGALVLLLTSERVTTPVRSGVRAVVDSVPRRSDVTYAVIRRREGLTDFPREWGHLIEHDRQLARRLLSQGNHFDTEVALGVGAGAVPSSALAPGGVAGTATVPSGAARFGGGFAVAEVVAGRVVGSDRSALRDFEDPVTRRAMEALVECDRLRTPVPPRGTRDVLGTEYGRAVAAFDAAVRAAEENADALARGTHRP